MKDRGFWKKLGDFALGKGFYIVLFLCVAAIGISGYYLIRTVTGGSHLRIGDRMYHLGWWDDLAGQELAEALARILEEG